MIPLSIVVFLLINISFGLLSAQNMLTDVLNNEVILTFGTNKTFLINKLF